MKLKKLAQRLALSLLTVLVSLVFLEVVLRAYHAMRDSMAPPALEILTYGPTIYEQNPEHPEINAQGLRDTEISIAKPDDAFRILVLGDSVAHGEHVPFDEAFPNQLERQLRDRVGTIDVINSGVRGYTAYNELQYYLRKGRAFAPDVVVVAFCMNDVVNPRLHWQYGAEKIVDIPDDAIPNHDYDRNHAIPKTEHKTSLFARSDLYKTLARRFEGLGQKNSTQKRTPYDKVPTHITGEDNISIEVLLDTTSPEWKWLSSTYDQLARAVEKDGATLVVALTPLAYQLDDGYPYFPQNQIVAYCQQRSIPCIDLLHTFKRHPKEDIFLLNRIEKSDKKSDIWHLTAFGHKLYAEALMHFLQANGFLPDAVTNIVPLATVAN